jgi:hypothetical protein
VRFRTVDRERSVVDLNRLPSNARKKIQNHAEQRIKVACILLGDFPQIVDDDEAVRNATETLVRSLGYHASTFGSADKFLNSEQVSDTSCLITVVLPVAALAAALLLAI